jgi:taurine dioxygenase
MDTFGVEVKGVDLREPLDAGTAAELRALFFKHRLLLFRDQDITAEQHFAFMSIINKVVVQPERSLEESLRAPMEAKVGWFSNRDKATFGPANNEFLFHADYQYTPQGALQALSLWAEVIDQQAPTSYVDMVDAVKRLPDDLREKVQYLVVENLLKFTGTTASGRDRMSQRTGGDLDRLWPHAQHPAISRHPVTGEEYLNVSEYQSSHIVGWTDEESDVIFDQLDAISYAPDHIYRHEWRVHDLIAWDNTALQHKRDAFPGPGERTLRRIAANPYELCEVQAAAENFDSDWKPIQWGDSEGGGLRYVNGQWVSD